MLTSQQTGTKKRITRRTFLGALGLAGISGGGGAFYMRFLEPHWFDVSERTVPVGAVPGRTPLKVLHLSDLHASQVISLEQIQSAVDLGVKLQPDLICLTGDYITRRYDRWKDYERVLSRLSRAAPTFACLGNHDGGSWSRRSRGYENANHVRSLLEGSSIQLLENRSAKFQAGQWRLNLVGLGDLWARGLNPSGAFSGAGKEDGSVTLALSHNPDSKAMLKPYAWDLVLCGHTHGGQLIVPLVGAPFAPVRDKRFIKGLHSWEGRWIHITKGVGNLHGMRFNCRPEVSLLKLV
jgi:uncharacterized protein